MPEDPEDSIPTVPNEVNALYRQIDQRYHEQARHCFNKAVASLERIDVSMLPGSTLLSKLGIQDLHPVLTLTCTLVDATIRVLEPRRRIASLSSMSTTIDDVVLWARGIRRPAPRA